MIFVVMPKLCFYFELHQPYRLAPYSIFDIGSDRSYFSHHKDENKQIFLKVAQKSYIPMLQLLYKLVQRHPEFVFSLSCSGVFLEQAAAYAPEVITLLKALVETGQVELLCETYYHSLASLYSKEEFFKQVKQHEQILNQMFKFTPSVFRNTELIYSDYIASLAAELGYTAILTEAVDRHLEGRSLTQLFSSYTQQRIPVLLKHAQLSDDIAFRFSNRSWVQYPLDARTYIHWLHSYQENELINLFMDFETFGEHQWEDTGIFDFFETVVSSALSFSWNTFVTPSEVIRGVDANTLPFYKVANPISWADIDRDLSAWRDNELQYDTLEKVYQLEKVLLDLKDPQLLQDWRKLQTSDHFYYMCIKWSNDGDVHAYFSPYDSPLDAYNRFTTVLADMHGRISHKIAERQREILTSEDTKGVQYG